MNKILLLCTLMLMSMALYAFTPIIDGIKDAEWGEIPTHSSTTVKQPLEFNLDGGCYVTDDPDYVYIAIPIDNDPWEDGKSVHLHVAIDLRNTPDGGTYDAWGSSISYGQPFKPEFDVITQWSTADENLGYSAFQQWIGGTWNAESNPPTGIHLRGEGCQCVEIAIHRSLLDNIEYTEVINISVWERPAWDKPGASICLPADPSFPSDWGNDGGVFTTQFPYTLATLHTVIVAPQVASIMQLTSSSFNLTFSEPMNQEAASVISNYNYGGGMIISSITPISPTTFNFQTISNLSGGTTYSVIAKPEIVSAEGTPIDPVHNSASFTAVSNSSVTFYVSLTALIESGGFDPELDQIAVRGDFNGWGITNADGIPHHVLPSTFFDVYGITVSVPYGIGQTFEYKYWNNHNSGDNWENLPTNRSFTIAGETNVIPVVYWNNVDPTTLITHPIAVTFKVDMLMQTVSSGVYLAGGFNSWNGTATQMTLDSGTIYKTTVTFPAYSTKAQEYKFLNGEAWEYTSNRAIVLDNEQTAMELPITYFNNIIPPEMKTITFLPKSLSTFTNFNNNDVLPPGSDINIETRETPADSCCEEDDDLVRVCYMELWPDEGDYDLNDLVVRYRLKLGSTYWGCTLQNGINVHDGETVEFYFTLTDSLGRVSIDNNGGANYHVSIGGGGLPSFTFLPMSLSTFTNFNNHDVLPPGSNLKLETLETPGGSFVSAKVYYRFEDTWPATGDYDMNDQNVAYHKNMASAYWQCTLVNGVNVHDGETVGFYVTATDSLGRVFMDNNGGVNYHVTIGAGDLPVFSFLPMSASTFTNFNNNDVLPPGSDLKLETVEIPSGSFVSVKVYYREDLWPKKGDYDMNDVLVRYSIDGRTYWNCTLHNGIDVQDGDTLEFYVTATDSLGRGYTDSNGGANYHVIIGEGNLPAPGNVQIHFYGDNIHLTWNEVSGATSYRVYYFDDPSHPNTLTSTDAIIPDITLVGHALLGKRFYRVTALK